MSLRIAGWIFLGIIVLTVAIIGIVKRNFFKESYQELKKVTWPTKDMALNSAIITVGFIFIFSICLAFIDFVINAIVMGLVR